MEKDIYIHIKKYLQSPKKKMKWEWGRSELGEIKIIFPCTNTLASLPSEIYVNIK